MMKIMMWGCLTIVLVAAGSGFMAWRWWETGGKQRALEEVRKGVDGALDQSGLPADDKKKLRARIDRAMADYKAGRIDVADMGRVLEELTSSPLLSAAAVQQALEEQLKDNAGAFPNEKKRAEARRTLERFIRAIVEKSVEEGKAAEIIQGLQEPDGKGGKRIKEHLSASEVETAVARMKKAADDAKVPNEPYHVDFVDEIVKIVDRVLAKKPAP